jgi:NADH dehydrogenase
VETVAELNDFVREGARSFRNIDPAAIRVMLVHSRAQILPELPDGLARFAQGLLQRRGVEMRMNTRVVGATPDYALLDDGTSVPTKTLVSTVPSAANPLVAALPCKKQNGRVVVDAHLEVPGYPGVWAAGDCAWVVEATSGQPCPPTAQHATRQARCLAGNIAASLEGSPKETFAFKALGQLAGLGHRSAVAEILGVKLQGFLAWGLWRSIYLAKMPGFDRKLRVAMDWTLDLVLPPDIVQLKTDKTSSLTREHFEKAEVIFRQGDRGDRLYVIVNGEVEILREDAGRPPAVLARLGPGECFGEMALVSDQPRMATVRSLSAVNVLTLDRAAFHELFAHLPPLRRLFQRLIAERTKDSGVPLPRDG